MPIRAVIVAYRVVCDAGFSGCWAVVGDGVSFLARDVDEVYRGASLRVEAPATRRRTSYKDSDPLRTLVRKEN